jgi:hypothetical protein
MLSDRAGARRTLSYDRGGADSGSADPRPWILNVSDDGVPLFLGQVDQVIEVPRPARLVGSDDRQAKTDAELKRFSIRAVPVMPDSLPYEAAARKTQ